MTEDNYGLKYKADGELTFGKQNVFFGSCFDDFEKWFPIITKDIFDQENNIVIWYDHSSEDNKVETKEYLDLLSKMKLFVFVITESFVTKYKNQGNIELDYAKANNIPIIPIIVEEEALESFNSVIGSIHSLERYTNRYYYTKKLEEYLNNALYDDEYLEKIRAAFDAYIFLSYRKKDRQYADKLMRLIHENEFCRDIAIWYDEYLKPGENFNDAIIDAIKQSQFFCLMITENLLEEGNYVNKIEYPYAIDNNKEVIPIEVEKTNIEELKKKFKNLNYVISAEDKDAFNNKISDIIKKSLNIEKINEPNHLFLIGLAYLNGIDLEKDVEKGISLIKKASESGLELALEKLVSIYKNGLGVSIDYKEAINFQNKLINQNDDINKKIDLLNLNVLNANYKVAVKYANELLNIVDSDKQKLTILQLLAKAYYCLDKYDEFIKCEENAYSLSLNVYSENNIETHKQLTSYLKAIKSNNRFDEETNKKIIEELEKQYNKTISNKDQKLQWFYTNQIAEFYYGACDYEKANIWFLKAFNIANKLYGHNSVETLDSEYGLSKSYIALGEKEKGIELLNNNVDTRTKYLGFNHPDVIETSDAIIETYISLADDYDEEENYEKMVELDEKAVDLSFKVYGTSSENTIFNLSMLHRAYLANNDNNKALETIQKAYQASLSVFGLLDATTALMARYVGLVYLKLNNSIEAEKYLKQFINTFDTIKFPDSAVYTTTMDKLIRILSENKNFEEAINLIERIVVRCKDSHRFESAAKFYILIGCLDKAKVLLDDEYDYLINKFGINHDYQPLALAYKELGNKERALELLKISQDYFIQTHGSSNRRIERTIKELENCS